MLAYSRMGIFLWQYSIAIQWESQKAGRFEGHHRESIPAKLLYDKGQEPG